MVEARYSARSCRLITVFLACAGCAFLAADSWAESFREQVEYGNALLNSGDFEGAREVFRDLQIEHPEDEVVYYSLGCADYEEGESAVALQDAQTAIEFFGAARDEFRQAMTSREKWLRVDAAYNHANSVAQIAKQTAFLGDQEATIAAFEESVAAYEDVLERYPAHDEARHNLEHMRYLLKRMLQNPPQEQEQQQNQDQENKQGQQEQEQEQEQQESSQDQQQEQQQSEEQSEQEQNQEEQEDQQQEQQQQEQQQTSASESQQEATGMEDQEEMEDRQTIEAILQSLESQDKREQQELRTGMPDSQIRREWW